MMSFKAKILLRNFREADANGDFELSPTEIKKFEKQEALNKTELKEIDLDSNKSISLNEWLQYQNGNAQLAQLFLENPRLTEIKENFHRAGVENDYDMFFILYDCYGDNFGLTRENDIIASAQQYFLWSQALSDVQLTNNRVYGILSQHPDAIYHMNDPSWPTPEDSVPNDGDMQSFLRALDGLHIQSPKEKSFFVKKLFEKNVLPEDYIKNFSKCIASLRSIGFLDHEISTIMQESLIKEHYIPEQLAAGIAELRTFLTDAEIRDFVLKIGNNSITKYFLSEESISFLHNSGLSSEKKKEVFAYCLSFESFDPFNAFSQMSQALEHRMKDAETRANFILQNYKLNEIYFLAQGKNIRDLLEFCGVSDAEFLPTLKMLSALKTPYGDLQPRLEELKTFLPEAELKKYIMSASNLDFLEKEQTEFFKNLHVSSEKKREIFEFCFRQQSKDKNTFAKFRGLSEAYKHIIPADDIRVNWLLQYPSPGDVSLSVELYGKEYAEQIEHLSVSTATKEALIDLPWQIYHFSNEANFAQLVRKGLRLGFSEAEMIELLTKACADNPTNENMISGMNALFDMYIIFHLHFSKQTMRTSALKFAQGRASEWNLDAGVEILAENLKTPKELKKFIDFFQQQSKYDFQEFILFLGNSRRTFQEKPIPLTKLLNLCKKVQEKFGLNFWGRYSIKIFEHLLEQNNKPNGKQKFAFIPSTISDWNGAFNTISTDLEFLIDNNYQILPLEAKNEQEIYQALNTIPDGAIDFFFPSFHASATAMHIAEQIGEEFTIDTQDEEWKKYAKKFAKGATMVMNACSTGEGGADADNLVKAFKLWFASVENLEIYGAPQPASLHLIIKNGRPFPVYSAGEAVKAEN